MFVVIDTGRVFRNSLISTTFGGQYMSKRTKISLKANEFVIIPIDYQTRFFNVTGKAHKGSHSATFNYFARKGQPVLAQDLYDIIADIKMSSSGFGSRGGSEESTRGFARANINWYANRGIFTVIREIS
jgi:hypothetical protein